MILAELLEEAIEIGVLIGHRKKPGFVVGLPRFKELKGLTSKDIKNIRIDFLDPIPETEYEKLTKRFDKCIL